MQNKMKLYPFKFEDDISVLNSDSIIANGFLAENSIDDVIETYLADLLGPKVLEYYRGELPVTVRISDINDRLPHLDCGSCGSPSCRAFAEDIVNGEAREDECIVKMRERIKHFLDQNESGRHGE